MEPYTAKHPMAFKSDLTRDMLGAGIEWRGQVNRDEAKLFLSQIAARVQNTNWMRMVVIGFLGENCSWKPKDLTDRLEAINHDIRQIRLRLQETAQPTPPAQEE